MNRHLEHLANRVSDDPMFLASALEAYGRSEGIDDGTLAKKLGCPKDVLPLLRLCRIPRAEAPEFFQDVARIAEHFKVNADVLAEVVRRGQVLMKMRGSTTSTGALLAARDKKRSSRQTNKGEAE